MADHGTQHDAAAESQTLSHAAGRIRLKVGAPAPAVAAEAVPAAPSAPKRGQVQPPGRTPQPVGAGDGR
jgi:hypothetical protein